MACEAVAVVAWLLVVCGCLAPQVKGVLALSLAARARICGPRPQRAGRSADCPFDVFHAVLAEVAQGPIAVVGQ
jgi:hypothetical protein